MIKKLDNRNSESGSVLIILLVIMLVLIAAGGFWVWQNFYARPFTPVELTNTEKKKLKFKLFALEQSAKKSGNPLFCIFLDFSDLASVSCPDSLGVSK